ncbi:MAG: ATP-binding protein [bacterium]
MKTPPIDSLRERAYRLGLWGVLARWDELADAAWLAELIAVEEDERQRRSLERRIQNAKLKRFKPMADFDWTWPTKIDRALVEELFTLQFLEERANVVLVGPNSVGKTTIAKNLAHQALLRGHTVRCVSASEMLNDLAAQDSAATLRNRIARYCRPALLVIDEVGYLSYAHRHADLLFEIVTRRYEERSTIVTTNKPFSEWNEVFPNASCVVTLVDRLIHRAESSPSKAEVLPVQRAKGAPREEREAPEKPSKSTHR